MIKWHDMTNPLINLNCNTFFGEYVGLVFAGTGAINRIINKESKKIIVIMVLLSSVLLARNMAPRKKTPEKAKHPL